MRIILQNREGAHMGCKSRCIMRIKARGINSMELQEISAYSSIVSNGKRNKNEFSLTHNVKLMTRCAKKYWRHLIMASDNYLGTEGTQINRIFDFKFIRDYHSHRQLDHLVYILKISGRPLWNDISFRLITLWVKRPVKWPIFVPK